MREFYKKIKTDAPAGATHWRVVSYPERTKKGKLISSGSAEYDTFTDTPPAGWHYLEAR